MEYEGVKVSYDGWPRSSTDGNEKFTPITHNRELDFGILFYSPESKSFLAFDAFFLDSTSI